MKKSNLMLILLLAVVYPCASWADPASLCASACGSLTSIWGLVPSNPTSADTTNDGQYACTGSNTGVELVSTNPHDTMVMRGKDRGSFSMNSGDDCVSGANFGGEFSSGETFYQTDEAFHQSSNKRPDVIRDAYFVGSMMGHPGHPKYNQLQWIYSNESCGHTVGSTTVWMCPICGCHT